MNTSNAALKQENEVLDTIKLTQKATWEDGDYSHFAKFMESGAIEILDNWNISPDTELLDVACGAGQTAIPAAKKGIRVTGIDIAENLILHARKRAKQARVPALFDIGDAENLPYSDNSFDVIITMFGAMFAPNPNKVVDEFSRVLSSGSQLYMANWTADSMPAQMFKTVSQFTPPPPGVMPPVLWGNEETVRERLSDQFTDIKLTKRLYPQWQYPFDSHELVNLFRTYFGPVKRAFEKITADQQKELYDTLESIYRNNSEFENGILTITNGEYLEVKATRR